MNNTPSSASGHGLWITWQQLALGATASIAYALLLYYHLHLLPAGDDWELATSLNTLGLWEFITHHYLYTNGRTPVLVAVGLVANGDILLWQLLNPALIVLFALILCGVTGKSAGLLDPPLRLIIAISLICTIDHRLLQESLWWVSGCVNYFWTLLAAVGTWAVLYRFYHSTAPTGYLGWLAVPLALIAGWGSEQSGAAALFLCGGTIGWYRLAEKRPVPVLHWVIMAAIGAGYAAQVGAPGNFQRVSASGTFFDQPLLERSLEQITQISHELFSLQSTLLSTLLILALLLLYSIRHCIAHRPATPLDRILPWLLGALIIATVLLHTLQTAAWMSLLFATLYYSVLAAVGWRLAREGNPLFLLFIGCAVATISMFALLPPIGPRKFLFTQFFTIAALLSLLPQLLQPLRRTLPGQLNWLLAGIALPFAAFAIYSCASDLPPLKENAATYRDNLHAMAHFRNRQQLLPGQVLVLKKLPNITHHWYMPYQNPFYISRFINYHRLPATTPLLWLGPVSDDAQRSIAATFHEFMPEMQARSDWFINLGNICKVRLWRDWLVLMGNSIGCVQAPFNITSIPRQGEALWYRNQNLHNDQYMLTLQNPFGAFQNFTTYKLPYPLENMQRLYVQWGQAEQTIIWQ